MKALLRLAAVIAVMSAACVAAPGGTTLYVSPAGNDAWSGRSPTPNAARTDGPLATLDGARLAVRRLKGGGAAGGPIKALLADGVYRVTGPVTFTPEDSGTQASPVTYAAAPGARPIISGGRPITGWQKAASGVWSAPAPEARGRAWVFRQLWVGDRRATLARSPNTGYYHIAGKAAPGRDPQTGNEVDRAKTAFRFTPGDIRAWPNSNDVNLKLFHIWETSLHPIASVDEAAATVALTGPAKWAFLSQDQNQRFLVENHPGALDAPGEWQLDRASGVVSLLPEAGEDPSKAVVTAPVAAQLLVLKGDPEAGLFVENVRFEGLSFRHAEWVLPAEGHSDWQAAVTVEAAIQADGARNCVLERCEVAHVGGYAVWLRQGCTGNRVAQCHIHDAGAGGVRIGEGGRQEGPRASGKNTVENCFIHDGGHIHGGAHGVWVGQASDNVVAHNEICDFYYTGISVGWSWGYSPTTCHRNQVEYNHIHNVGRQVLSDMAGIYTLGISTGTVIRNNLVHDCWGYEKSGSGGIYPDEGSTGILIENNVVYHTQNGGLSIHYGQDLTVRNNIFAFSRDRQVSRGRLDKETNFVFERNIVYYDRGGLYTGNGKVTPDYNVYFTLGEDPVTFPEDLDLKGWQAQGMDAHSAIADPLFVDPKRFDFRLREGSPALKLGFRPIDVSTCGLTGPPEWVSLPRQIKRPASVIPERPKLKPVMVDDGFENTPAGVTPELAVVWGEAGNAKVRVTDEVAAGGKHSLQFTDAPGMDFPYNPHLWYTPHLDEGVATLSFDLRVGPGALAWIEWRDAASPYHTGPSVGTDAEGRLLAGKQPVAELPPDTWVHIEMTCALGKQANGKWDLAVTLPGAEPIRLEGLPCQTTFRKLEWLGIVSNATEATVFHVDNVKLQVRK